MNKVKLIVSTDLDGTLLNHDDYSYEAALPAIDYLKKLEIPLILNTSKTKAELLPLVEELKVNWFVVENGSALCIRKSIEPDLEFLKHARVIEDDRWWVLQFGHNREDLKQFMAYVRDQLGFSFEAYSDWNVSQLMSYTGLTAEQAQLSLNKEFSEPFLWHDSEENLSRLKGKAESLGFTLVKGGRFYHLQGACSKATPLEFIKQHNLIPGANEEDLQVIALGDNQNDVSMLNIADYPICIKSPKDDFPSLQTNATIIYSQLEGAAGWNETLIKLLKEIESYE